MLTPTPAKLLTIPTGAVLGSVLSTYLVGRGNSNTQDLINAFIMGGVAGGVLAAIM